MLLFERGRHLVLAWSGYLGCLTARGELLLSGPEGADVSLPSLALEISLVDHVLVVGLRTRVRVATEAVVFSIAYEVGRESPLLDLLKSLLVRARPNVDSSLVVHSVLNPNIC